MINLFIFFLVSLVLTFLIFMVVYLINSRQDLLDYEKKSAYECGFEPFGDSRSFFDVQFYVIGLLFVVFDLEVVFLIPFIADISNISLFGYLNFLLFMSVVLVGFFYEWKIGLLNWVPTQNRLYHSNGGIFLFVLILAPQIFAGTIKSIKNAYFLFKYYRPQVWELVSLPLQYFLAVSSLIMVYLCYKRYVLDVEKQFPFTNPYQFAKVELERREREMEKMQEITRGAIATWFVTIVTWLSFKVWPVYSGDKRNFFSYWGDFWYSEFCNNYIPLPANKLDLIHPDVANAVSFQTLERSNSNNITNLWEYGAMLNNENYTSPLEARYDRLACHVDGWKAMHRTIVKPNIEDLGDVNLVWKYQHVALSGNWQSIPHPQDRMMLPGVSVPHSLDLMVLDWKRELTTGLWAWKYKWVWEHEVNRAYQGQKLKAFEERIQIFPDLEIHRSAFDKIQHLIKVSGDEWSVIMKYYKYFHNTQYYNRLFGVNRGYMDVIPPKLLQLPKNMYSEDVFNHAGFPYSVGHYGSFYRWLHAPLEGIRNAAIFDAFNDLPFNVEERFFLQYKGMTPFEFPILAAFALLSSVFVFQKVATFFCKNFINNFVKFWFFFRHHTFGKEKNLGFRNLLYGSTIVSDSKNSLEGLYWIFLKFQENLLEIIIHARWYHIIPAFLVLFLGLLMARLGNRYVEKGPGDDGTPAWRHRRYAGSGAYIRWSIWGKLKFFVISAPSDFLVDELFMQQVGGQLSLYQKFFLLLPELVLCLGLFLILFYTGRSLSFLQSLTVYVFRACFLSLLVTFSIIGVGKYSKCLFIFDETYQFSIWSQCIKTAILMLAVFFILYFDLGDLVPNEFIKFLVIFILLAFVLASNRSFFLLLIALEGISLLAYVTASAEKSYGGIAAAVKYFSIGAIGSVLLLWSALHMYPVILHMSYDSVFILVRKYELQNFEMLEIIEFFSTLLTFGITVKMGVAPFHQWVADLYAGTSAYINAVFAILIKAVVFFSIFEVLCSLLCDVLFKFTLIYSLVLGCYFSVKQNEVRRLIAYSSIVHTSFLLVGDAVVSITYMLTYICSNVLFFASLLLYEKMENDESVWLNDLGNFSKYGYSNAGLFSVGLFSMMGLPPFAGFFGKIMVWISLIEDFYFYNELYSYAFFILSIMLSIIISLYYIKIVIYIFAPKETAFILTHGYDSIFINGLKSKLVVQYFALYFVVTWAFWHEDIISLVLFLVTDLC